jgi:uncharacterized protein
MKTIIRMVPVILICLLLGSPAVHVCGLGSSLQRVENLAVPQAHANSSAVPSVMWEDLQQLDLKTGNAPASLKKLDNTVVRVPGFVIPLEDNEQAVSEFLLVPFPMACIHVPAPPPNLIVHVKMDKGKKVAFDFYAPVWAQGRLKIQSTQNVYTEASYFMNGTLVEPYKPEKKAP